MNRIRMTRKMMIDGGQPPAIYWRGNVTKLQTQYSYLKMYWGLNTSMYLYIQYNNTTCFALPCFLFFLHVLYYGVKELKSSMAIRLVVQRYVLRGTGWRNIRIASPVVASELAGVAGVAGVATSGSALSWTQT